MTVDELNAELAAWPDRNRNEQDLRFGQYIAAKYGVIIEGDQYDSFYVEDKMTAYHMLVEGLTNG